jgi:hypothetical protein
LVLIPDDQGGGWLYPRSVPWESHGVGMHFAQNGEEWGKEKKEKEKKTRTGG